jgi:hypothetical protein
MESVDGKDKKHGSMNTYKRHWIISGRRQIVKVITVVTFKVLQGFYAMSADK